MSFFIETTPSLESYWRGIILLGRNVASYKFALGQALIDLGAEGKSHFTLEEVAVPFSTHLTRHLKDAPKQSTSPSSQFLDACRRYNEGELGQEQLVAETVRLGFNNVIDAFHIVGGTETPVRFFVDQRKGANPGIEVTDEFSKLTQAPQFENLFAEVDARWRLVETAWELELPSRMLISYDPSTEMLLAHRELSRRPDITAGRDALNGYQKGKCFYCFADISIQPGSPLLADVDHFIPRMLLGHLPSATLDGVWNLVLACQGCNRGPGGKFEMLPAIDLLERLHTRNEFLIESRHPLRETLIAQTGTSTDERVSFLQRMYSEATNLLPGRWEPPETRGPAAF